MTKLKIIRNKLCLTKSVKYVVLFVTAYSGVLSLKGQVLSVNSTQTPTQLVQTILLGGGVTASNITYNGALLTIGSFNGSTSNIGFGSGIILATGNINVAVGPNNSGSQSNGGSGTTSNDPQLSSIATNTLYDAQILEFDFVPLSDSVKFRYVFASEEYPEFVCSNFNDVFGFFISGPNPAGGSYTNKNIAIVPGSNPAMAVAINSVNSGVVGADGDVGGCTSLGYSSLFVDNSGGTTVEYDGFTVPLTAKEHVICGQSYHIKIAIADVGDADYDSGVFLEAGSFSSGSVVIVPEISYGGSNDSTLFEGCGTACIYFIRTSDISQTDTINVTIGGSAINGVDYNMGVSGVPIPSQLIFQAGQDSISYCINAVSDGVTEGLDTITLSILQIGTCMSASTNATIYLNEFLPILVNTIGDTTFCNVSGNTVLSAIVSGGLPPYTYSWTNGASPVSSPTVSPTSTSTYVVTVNDACVGSPDPSPSVVDSATVTIISIPEITNTITSGYISDSSFYEGCGQACFYFERNLNLAHAETFQLNIAGTATGIVDYTTLPSQLNFAIGQDSLMFCISTNTDVLAEGTETIMLSINTTGTCIMASNDMLNIVEPFPMALTVGNDTSLICQPGPVDLFANVTGGVPPYTYSWTNGGGTSSTTTVTPSGTTTYVINVSDNCNNIPDPTPGLSDSVKITVVTFSPLVLDAGNDLNVCPGDILNLTAIANGGGAPYLYNWTTISGSDQLSSSNTSATSVLATSPDVFQVSVTDICGTVQNDQVTVSVEESCEISIPNVITPNGVGSGMNELFYIENLDKFPNSGLEVYNRWGTKIYESSFYMNNWNGGKMVDGTYYYVLTVPASGHALPKLKPAIKYDIKIQSENDKRVFAGFFQILGSVN